MQNTGLVIGATFRLQLNADLQTYHDMPSFANVPNVMFPLIWVEQTAVATEELLAPVKTLATYIHILDTATGVLLTASVAFMSLALLWAGKNNNWNIRRMVSSDSKVV